MAAVRSSSSLGVSALLDELLAEVPGKAQDSIPLPPMSERSEEAFSARVLEQQALKQAEQEMPDREVLMTPRAAQIAELCGEMDSCMAALDKMEQDNKLRHQALQRELAVMDQHRVDYPALFSPGSASEAEAEVGFSRVDTDGYQLESSPAPTDHRKTEDPFAASDEERIAKLRNEVEALRIREAEMQRELEQQWLDFEAMGGSPNHSASEVEGVHTSEFRSVDLAALVQEADNVLGEADLVLGARQYDEQVPINTAALSQLEYRLAEAQRDLGNLEGIMDSAGGALDAEINELEQLLAAEGMRGIAGSNEPDEEAIPA